MINSMHMTDTRVQPNQRGEHRKRRRVDYPDSSTNDSVYWGVLNLGLETILMIGIGTGVIRTPLVLSPPRLWFCLQTGCSRAWRHSSGRQIDIPSCSLFKSVFLSC